MKKPQHTKPFDRKEVFILAFKQHYGTILAVSLAMLIFALPTIFAIGWSYIELYLLGNVTSANAVQMYEIQTRMYLWLIPAFVILSVGISGAFYVIRRLVWDESVLFFRDFFRGIKNNFWQTMIVSVLFVLFLGGLNYAMNVLVLNANLGSVYWMLFVVQIFLAVTALMLLLFQYAIIAVYKDNLWNIIKNSFALVWTSYLRSLAMLVLSFAPVLLMFLFSNVYVVYIVILILLSLVGFGYGILTFTLHTHYIFDKRINKNYFPQIYKKGLYNEGTTIYFDGTDSPTEPSNVDVE